MPEADLNKLPAIVPPDQPEEDWHLYERQYRIAYTGYHSFAEFQAAIRAVRARLSPGQFNLVQQWIAIGNENPWISEAQDPPFNELSFRICQDFRELADWLLNSGRWSLGQAFALEDICFINQIDGGDEWLTIRGTVPFESITMQTYHETREEAEARLAATIESIRSATDEQLRSLKY